MKLPSLPVLEKGIIHGVLADSALLHEPEILTLKSEHFFNHSVGTIWEFIRVAYQEHGSTGYELLHPYLQHPKWPQDISLTKLLDFDKCAISYPVFRAAVREVQKAWVIRELQREFAQGIRSLNDLADPNSLMTALQGKFDLLRNVQAPSGVLTLGEVAQGSPERLTQKVGMNGVSTGFRCLDARNFYWQNSTLSILGGRPGMGKSTIFSQFCQNAALMGNTPLLFTFEDGPEDTADRSLIRMSGVPRKLFQQGLHVHNQQRVQKALSRLTDLPFHVNDADRHIDRLIAHSHRMVKQHGINVIFIDQLSHIEVSRMPIGVENRNQLLGWICKQLIHEVAKPLNVPVILASQLQRVDTVKDKDTGFTVAPEPGLQSLRDSGELENHAYRALAIHRPEYYDSRNRPGEADLILLKNRNGPADRVTVNANMELYTFEEGETA